MAWASTDMRLRQGSSVRGSPRGHDPRGFVEDYAEEKGRGMPTKAWLYLWQLRNVRLRTPVVAALTVGASVAAIQFVDSALVAIASAMNMFVVFILLLQRGNLRRLGTFRRQHNSLRKHVYYLRQERERLHRTMDRLDETVADLHEVPHELHRVSKDPNVDKIMRLVEEHRTVQEDIREALHQKVLQQILDVVVGADSDQDWILRPTEIERLIVRIGFIEGIEFDQKRFRSMLKDDPSVSTVMNIIRSLLDRDDEFDYGDPLFKVTMV